MIYNTRRSKSIPRFGLSLSLVLLAISCTGFPKPSQEKTALLLVAWQFPEEAGTTTRSSVSDVLTWQSQDKPERTFRLAATAVLKAPYLAVVIPAGNWQLLSRTITDAAGTWEQPVEEPAVMELAEHMVYLYPKQMILTEAEQGRLTGSTVPVTAELQARIAAELEDQVNFAFWAGSSFVGFGSSIPQASRQLDSHALSLSSSPSQAAVYLDDEYAGSTPLTIQTKAGKHLLEIHKSGFEPYRSYVELTSDMEFQLTLTQQTVLAETSSPASPLQTTAQPSGTYRLLVAPFTNRGMAADDYLARLFQTSLMVLMERDRRIELLDASTVDTLADTEASADSQQLLPDFGTANRAAADLLIAGEYLVRGTTVFVHSSLYDVRREGIKTATTNLGLAGLEIFETIDDMTLQIARAVDRVLPETGKAIVHQEIARASLVEIQKRYSIEELITDRQRFGNAWQFSLGLAGVFTEARLFDWSSAGQVALTPPLSPELSWQYLSAFPLSLLVGAGLQFYGLYQNSGWQLEPFARAALELSVPGESADMFLRLGWHVQYVGDMTIKQTSQGITRQQYLPASLTHGPVLEVGSRVYTRQRLSRPLTFQSFGFGLSPFIQRIHLSEAVPETDNIYFKLFWSTGVRR